MLGQVCITRHMDVCILSKYTKIKNNLAYGVTVRNVHAHTVLFC